MIRKKRKKNLWEVLSENSGRSFGTYTTREEAEKRLQQIEYFKKLRRK